MQKETYEDKILRELTDEKLSEIIKKTDNNTMVAHYTTMEGFIGLLNSADVSNGEPMLKMWASNIFALNDPTEFMYGYDIIRKWLPKIESQLKVRDEDKLSRIWNACPYAKKNNTYYNKLLRDSLYNRDNSVYVLSFSHKTDDLQMFRLYSHNATGVCIEFSLGKVGETCSLNNVDYEAKTDDSIFLPYGRVKSNYRLYLNKLHERQLNDEAKFELMLTHLVAYIKINAPLIKKEEYKEEQEIRYSNLYSLTDGIKKRENKNGNTIPYKEVKIPLKAMKKVIIGPCADFNKSKNAIELKFKSMGISDIPLIVKSKNSYRNY